MNIYEVLNRAADFGQENGWGRKWFPTEGCPEPVCLEGAMRLAALELGGESWASVEIDAKRAVSEYLATTRPDLVRSDASLRGRVLLFAWYDGYHGEKPAHSEVEEVLRAAAAVSLTHAAAESERAGAGAVAS